MCTNKFSIGGLRGVHVGSSVYEVIRTICSMFISFVRKNLEHKKVQKCKTNDFYPLRSFCAGENFLPLLFSVRLFCFVSWFLLGMCFWELKIFL